MYQFGNFQEYQIWLMQCANGTILVARRKNNLYQDESPRCPSWKMILKKMCKDV